MMENPMVQRMLENPDTIRAMINSNPMLQAMIQQNPQLEHVLSDPQTMRQAMQAATNPAMMQELMRSQDRALANIESLPGGHNALRRMYEQDIDPMVRAAEETSERMYEQQQQQQRTAAQQQQASPSATGPSASPMPNPWSAPPPQQPRQQQAPPPGMAGLERWAAAMGGAGGMPTAPGAAPGGPMFASMSQMMQDPEYMRRLMEPANMQAMMQLQQAMQQLQRGGVFPEGTVPSFPMPGMPAMPSAGAFPPPPTGAGFPSAAFPGLFSPAAATPAAPHQPPEVRFASQLTQLESMGFIDRESNIRALTATNGNVNAAIERLLQ
jgi:ubiquilin